MNLPRLVRSAQTSIAGAREYWRGWPVENTVLPQVYYLFAAGHNNKLSKILKKAIKIWKKKNYFFCQCHTQLQHNTCTFRHRNESYNSSQSGAKTDDHWVEKQHNWATQIVEMSRESAFSQWDELIFVQVTDGEDESWMRRREGDLDGVGELRWRGWEEGNILKGVWEDSRVNGWRGEWADVLGGSGRDAESQKICGESFSFTFDRLGRMKARGWIFGRAIVARWEVKIQLRVRESGKKKWSMQHSQRLYKNGHSAGLWKPLNCATKNTRRVLQLSTHREGIRTKIIL